MRDNRNAFLGTKPLPLIDTLHEGRYCNAFASDAGDCTVLTFYNDGEEAIEGPLACLPFDGFHSAREPWQGAPAGIAAIGGRAAVCGRVPPGDVSVILALK